MNIKTGPVREITFRTEHRTDGKIAIDDDQTTPVFSPYSGRVTRIFAKPGDEVEEGAPLFAIQAFEFVQAQSDLVTTAANLAAAQARLKLAETNEQSLRQSYEAKGGAPTDWQQSQVELAAAQAGLRSATIALAAVRNRFRIFGKSDKEIDALEGELNGQRMNPEVIVSAPVAGTITDREVATGRRVKREGLPAPSLYIGAHAASFGSCQLLDIPGSSRGIADDGAGASGRRWTSSSRARARRLQMRSWHDDSPLAYCSRNERRRLSVIGEMKKSIAARSPLMIRTSAGMPG